MQAELNDLIAILEQQRDHQAALVELSDRKTKAISGGDVTVLHGIVEEEKAALDRIKAVEALQDGCVKRLAQALGLPADQVRMSLILQKAQGSQREKLMALRDELTGLVDKQIRYNETNMRLLQMNLDYVQVLLNAATNQKTGTTYGSGGSMQRQEGSARRLLDRKV